MEQVFTINCRALTLLLLLVTLNTCQANSVKYKKVGDTVVLSPGSVSAPITSITWKHNSNLAVEWYGDKIDFYPKFKDRCELNTTTGELTCLRVTLEDSGSYTAEINNRVLNPNEIKVISEVPTPTVSESCDAEKTHCVLTCEGITTDAEPVVYSWWSGDVMKSKTKELNITKEEKSSFFWCTMINPFSTKSSKQVVNPVLVYNTDIYKKLGDKVVLSPGPVTDINTIVWKHGLNIAVEWFGGDVKYSKDRCTMNTATGELTFLSVTLEHSGSYTAEINNRVMNTTEILVISEVPTPTVSESCDAEKTYCVLTCEGITTDAEPVVYSWWSGDVMKSKTKELRITKEEKEPPLFCKMKNPVSSKSSKEVLNPFITFSSNTGNNDLHWLLILLLVLVVVVIVAVIGVFIYKHRTGNFPPPLLRVLPCLTTNVRPADSSQPSLIPAPEMKPLLNGNNDVVQTISETDDRVKSPQDHTMGVSTGTINDHETTPGKPANQGPPPAKPPRSSSFFETTPGKPANQGPPTESPTPSPSGTSDQPEGEEQPHNGGGNNETETSVVVESPPDLEKTTETPNSEALNSNMEEKQENETNAEVF